MKIISIINDIKKSIKQTITVLAGTISRGKYTLVNKLELVISELAASLKDDVKNCHGKVAAHTSKTLGVPVGTLESNNHPINTIAKMVRRGFIILHKTPIAVCLYLTKISRQAKK